MTDTDTKPTRFSDQVLEEFYPERSRQGQDTTPQSPGFSDDVMREYYPESTKQSRVTIQTPEKPQEKKRGSSFGAFLHSLAATPENLASSVIQGVQGQSGASVADAGIADRFVNWVDERNKARSEKYAGTGDFIPGLISKQDLAELAQNLGFSISSLGASAAGGAAAGSVAPGPGTLAGGIAGFVGGMAGGGASAYRMQAYQTMNDWLKKKNEESIRQFGRGISKEEENAFKKQFKSLATETGLWEAGPEAIGNALELALAFGKGTLPGRIASFMPKGMAGKALTAAGRAAGVLGTEEATETVTQMGQHNVEVKAGQSPEPMRQWTSGDDWLKSAGEVLPQVVLLSGLLSTGGATYRKVTGNKEQEQYYKNIAKQTGLEEDIKQWKADNVPDKEIASRVSSRLDEYRTKILPKINAELSDDQKMPEIPDEIDAAGMVKYVLRPDAAPAGKKISSAKERILRSMGMRPKNTAAPSAEQAPMTTSMGESKTIVTEPTRQANIDDQEAKQTKNAFDAVINENLNNQAEMEAARQAEETRRNEETARIAQQEEERVSAAVADAQAQGASLKTSLAGADARKQKIVDDVLNLTEKRLLTAVQKEAGLTIAPSGPGIYSIETPDGPQPMNLLQIRQTLAQKRIEKLDAKDTKDAAEAQSRTEASLRLEEKKEIQRQAAALNAARTALKPTPEQIEFLAANRDKLNDKEIEWLDRLSAPIAPKAVQGSTFKVEEGKNTLDSRLRGNDKEKSGNDNTRENPEYVPENIADSQEHINALIPLMIADLDNSGSAGLVHNTEEKTTTRQSAGIGWLTAANNKGGIKVDRAEARTVLTKVQSKETLTPRQQDIFDAIIDAADKQTGGKMAEALHWAGKGFIPLEGKKIETDELVEGDRFVIANEEFAVTDIDEEGDVTMKDGTIRTVRQGTTINDVDYIKRNEEAESFNPEEFNEEKNPPASPFKKGGEPEEPPPAERRKDLSRRKAIDDMTEEEKTQALRYNEKSGLLSERTFKENPRLKYQAAIDGDSLGAINDNFGHEAGDALLMLWGDALRASGIETSYHFHGDEMWLEHDNQKTLEAGIQKAYDYLNEHPIEVAALKTGYTYYLHGGFSYGIGTDAKSADQALYQNKQTRLEAGERAEKGTLPPRIYSADAGMGVHQDRRENLSETEEVTPPASDKNKISNSVAMTTGLTKKTTQELSETFLDQKGQEIYVDEGPNGNWSFYRKTETGGRQRLNLRGEKWFATKEKAITALSQYAQKNQWKPGKKEAIQKTPAELGAGTLWESEEARQRAEQAIKKNRAVEITTGLKEKTPAAEKPVENKNKKENIITAEKVISLLKSETPVKPAPEAPQTKEPWQMTRDEFAQIGVDNNFPKDENGKYWTYNEGKKVIVPDEEIERLKNDVFAGSHKDRVAQALSEGKPVPPEVLKDYPEMKKTLDSGLRRNDNDNGGPMLSVEKRNKIDKETQDFSKQLDDFIERGKKGQHNYPNLLNISGTPDVLLKLGAEQYPITMSAKVASKILSDRGDRKALPVDTVKQLPAAVADPIMVLDSKTSPNKSLVVVTELKSPEGRTVIAAIYLNQINKSHRVNAIGSVYGKNEIKWFIEQIKEGRLRYINKNKSRQWSQSAGLQLPLEEAVNDSLNNKILSEDDLVKGKLSVENKNTAPVRLGDTDLKELVQNFAAIAKGVEVIERDGQLWLKTKSGEEVKIDAVEEINPGTVSLTINKHYAKEKMAGKRIAGMFQPGAVKKITLVEDVAGIWTLSHEFEHFLEDIGAISTADKNLLDKKIAYLIRKEPEKYGYLKGRSNAEKRAEWIGRTLTGMYDANTPVGKILQKIRNIIDRIINALGIRTAYGVVRDIETGKIYNEPVAPMKSETKANYPRSEATRDKDSSKFNVQRSTLDDSHFAIDQNNKSTIIDSMTPKKGTGNITAKDNPTPEADFITNKYNNDKPKAFYHASFNDFDNIRADISDRGGIYLLDEELFPIDEFADNLKNKKYLAEKEIDKKRRDFEEEFDEDGFGKYSNLSRFYGDKVYPFAISKDAKLLDLTKDENIKYFEDNSVPIQKMAKEIDPDSDDAVADMLSHFYDTPAERLIHQEAKRLGFDGVIIEDSSEGMPHKSYVIYDPKFLKHYSELPNPFRPPEVGGQSNTQLSIDEDVTPEKSWIPASAGMTEKNAGMTNKSAGKLAEDVTEQVVKAAEKKVSRAVDIVTGRVSPEKREAWAAFKKSWSEFWKPFSTVPDGDKVLARRYESMGNVAKAVRFIEAIQEQLSAYPDEVKKDMFRYLDGQIPLEILPEDARDVAKNLQRRTEIIGEMLADRGIISQDTFEEHKGKYVHYLYAKHIVGEDAPVGITSSGKLDLSYTLARNRNLTPQQRKELGLIEDASVAVPVGMGKALTDIAKFDYLKTIAENSEWTWQPSIVHVPIGKPLKNAIYGRTRRYVTYGIGKLVDEVKRYDEMMRVKPSPEVNFIHKELIKALDAAQKKTGNAPDNYEQLPNSKGYGPLAGAYVLKPIAADLKPVMDAIGNDHGELFKTILSIEKQGMAAFKMGKVALNIPTACRNIVSNIIQMNMRGRALYKIPGDIISACESLKAKDKYYEEAQSMGLFNTNWFVTEINDVMQEFRKVENGRIDQIVTAVKNVAKYYGKIDDISKLAIYRQMREHEGASIDEATLEAMKWGMDYSLSSRSIKGLRQTIMPFACVDEETEILTKRGWLHHQELKENDAALSFDLTDSQLKWKLVADIYRAKYDGDMLHFQDRHLDMMLTPDHKCIVYENKQKNFNKWKEYNFKYAHALNTQSKIPVAGYYDQCPKIATISDAFVQIIAWIVTEGHYKRNTAQVCISQNEGEKFDAIKKALDQEFPNDYLIQRIRKNQMVFHIHAKHGRRVRAFAPNKQLTPEFVLSLTRPQLLLLFQTMIAGDGSRRKDGRWMFIQKNNQTLQSFQMMLVLLGISYGYGQHGENCKAITMRNNWHYSLKRTKPEKVHYTGTIWCPAIPGTETWVARRNGKVFLTGNTYQYKISSLIAESIKKRPWVLAKFALIYPAAKMLAMALNDLDDDDWDDLQKQLPAYIKKSGSMMILPFKTDKDQWQWVNLEYYFPFGNMLAIFRDAKALDSGEALRDLGIGNPFLNMFFTGTSAREDQPPLHSYFGTPVYNQLDPAPVKAAKYLEYMANTWMPSMLTRQGAAGYMGKVVAGTGILGDWVKEKFGGEDRWGRTVTLPQALGRWFGFNIVAVSPEQSRAQVAVKMQDLRKEMARIESNPSYSEEDKADYRSRLNEKMAELAEQAPSAVLPITKAKGKDVVYDALKDMAAEGILHTAPPSRTLDVYGVPMTMSMEQYRDYLDRSSDIARRKLEPLVSSPAWAQMPPARRGEVVSHIVANARKSVRQQVKAQLRKVNSE
ncbi:MAG: diguanylate cyclase [Smithella sp.]